MSVAYHTAPSLGAMNVEYSRDLSSWRKATSCPVCGDGRIVPFATLRHIPHSRCRDCGFTFANPLPPDELLGDFYNSSYYANFRQFELDRACQDHYGRIFITTPAVNNLVGRLIPSHSAHYSATFPVSMFTMLAVRRLLARFDFDVQASDTDANVELIQALAVVPFYDLDFVSPRSASDASDLYTCQPRWAYVRAWVWVDFAGTDLDKEVEEGEEEADEQASTLQASADKG